jgi:putative hydrolase of the HAD superfamily
VAARMSIQTVFFDVGGVLMTNGWDHISRRRATDHFGMDWEEFEDRHNLVVADFEIGRIGMKEYLDSTAFHLPRAFTQAEFIAFIQAQSVPNTAVLAFAAELSASGKYLMATLNNESRELNQYRIDRFQLRNSFRLFFSSGFVGIRKPDERIFQLALDVTQKKPEECLFIDDHALNVERAQLAGMQAFQYRDAVQLRKDFQQKCEGQ